MNGLDPLGDCGDATPASPTCGEAAHKRTALIVGEGQPSGDVESVLKALPQEHMSREVRSLLPDRFGVKRVAPRELLSRIASVIQNLQDPNFISLIVADLSEVKQPEEAEALLRALDVINPEPLWKFGPTCFARLPESLQAPNTKRLRTKWAFCPPGETNFANWLKEYLRTKTGHESLPERAKRAISEEPTVRVPEGVIDAACRLLDLWKDAEDPTQLESPLNRYLQMTKVGILAQLRAPVDLGPGDVARELRNGLTVALAGEAFRRARAGSQEQVPPDFPARIDSYLDLGVDLPLVRLRAPLLRSLFLIVFTRILARRFPTRESFDPPSPICRATSENGGVTVTFGVSPEELLKGVGSDVPLDGFVLTDIDTKEAIASTHTSQTSVSFWFKAALRPDRG